MVVLSLKCVLFLVHLIVAVPFEADDLLKLQSKEHDNIRMVSPSYIRNLESAYDQSLYNIPIPANVNTNNNRNIQVPLNKQRSEIDDVIKLNVKGTTLENLLLQSNQASKTNNNNQVPFVNNLFNKNENKVHAQNLQGLEISKQIYPQNINRISLENVQKNLPRSTLYEGSPILQNILSRPDLIKNIFAPRVQKKQYTVVYPNGTIDYVNEYDSIARKYPNHVVINAEDLSRFRNTNINNNNKFSLETNDIPKIQSNVPLSFNEVQNNENKATISKQDGGITKKSNDFEVQKLENIALSVTPAVPESQLALATESILPSETDKSSNKHLTLSPSTLFSVTNTTKENITRDVNKNTIDLNTSEKLKTPLIKKSITESIIQVPNNVTINSNTNLHTKHLPRNEKIEQPDVLTSSNIEEDTTINTTDNDNEFKPIEELHEFNTKSTNDTNEIISPPQDPTKTENKEQHLSQVENYSITPFAADKIDNTTNNTNIVALNVTTIKPVQDLTHSNVVGQNETLAQSNMYNNTVNTIETDLITNSSASSSENLNKIKDNETYDLDLKDDIEYGKGNSDTNKTENIENIIDDVNSDWLDNEKVYLTDDLLHRDDVINSDINEDYFDDINFNKDDSTSVSQNDTEKQISFNSQKSDFLKMLFGNADDQDLFFIYYPPTEPLIERNTKTVIYPNGTVVEEITEILNRDGGPSIKTTTTIVHNNDTDEFD